MKIKISMMMSAVVLLTAISIAGAQTGQVLLPGALIPKFVDPLPVGTTNQTNKRGITVVDATALPEDGTFVPYNITMGEFRAKILPATAPTTPAYTGSWVWGYLTDEDVKDTGANIRESYLGPVIVAKRGVETRPTYINALPYGIDSNVQQLLPTDQTLDWADPLNSACAGLPPTGTCGSIYQGPQPAVPHIHGGEVAPLYDGGPDAWWLPVNPLKNVVGSGSPAVPGSGMAEYIYPNQQQAGTIWFHDHALGITRLNVSAGMAGLHIITDSANEPQQAESNCPTGGCLPNAAYDIPLIIQDRSFDTAGQIFYNLASNPQPNINVHPFWIPEFIGDTIVVNGKTWPYLSVEPRKYRFRLVNGSNARFYDLTLTRGLPFTVIATDDGYLNAPVKTKNLIIGPGERYEVIVDFAASAGKNIVMMNAARTPFPGGAKVVPGTTDTVMQFRVGLTRDPNIADATLPANLRPNNPIVDIKTPAVANRPIPVAGACPEVSSNQTIVRQLTLNEVIGPGGPLELVLNNTKYNGSSNISAQFGQRDSEQPAVGDTEIWEIINITADAHPIHTHLASFQVLSRQVLQAASWTNIYASQLAALGVLDGQGPPNPYLTRNADCAIGGNPAIGPYLQLKKGPIVQPYEAGWKDTVIAYPGEVTRIVVRWAPTETAVEAVSAGQNLYPFDPTALIGGVGYVWHCHIIDHEDNEMMRPYVVGAARQGIN